ncbi:hypothetical protein SDC9_11908 [bioreactor metagenome]|uniref:Uncharacterized protein n=1 Tax=bioreactor metagenome TaxID=1076179 RepID=A0A644THN6_9ZZZZ
MTTFKMLNILGNTIWMKNYYKDKLQNKFNNLYFLAQIGISKINYTKILGLSIFDTKTMNSLFFYIL